MAFQFFALGGIGVDGVSCAAGACQLAGCTSRAIGGQLRVKLGCKPVSVETLNPVTLQGVGGCSPAFGGLV